MLTGDAPRPIINRSDQNEPATVDSGAIPGRFFRFYFERWLSAIHLTTSKQAFVTIVDYFLQKSDSGVIDRSDFADESALLFILASGQRV